MLTTHSVGEILTSRNLSCVTDYYKSLRVRVPFLLLSCSQCVTFIVSPESRVTINRHSNRRLHLGPTHLFSRAVWINYALTPLTTSHRSFRTTGGLDTVTVDVLHCQASSRESNSGRSSLSHIVDQTTGPPTTGSQRCSAV